MRLQIGIKGCPCFGAQCRHISVRAALRPFMTAVPVNAPVTASACNDHQRDVAAPHHGIRRMAGPGRTYAFADRPAQSFRLWTGCPQSGRNPCHCLGPARLADQDCKGGSVRNSRTGRPLERRSRLVIQSPWRKSLTPAPGRPPIEAGPGADRALNQRSTGDGRCYSSTDLGALRPLLR
jgi:hypothetical protein